jgi:hypothetical protein
MNRRRWIVSAVLVGAALIATPRLLNWLFFFDQAIKIPTITSGHILQSGQEIALTQAQVTSLNSWLQTHRAGWSRNVVSYPPSNTHLILDSAGKKGAVSMTIWLDSGASASLLVILEGDYSPKVLAETFSSTELAPLKGLVIIHDSVPSSGGQR